MILIVTSFIMVVLPLAYFQSFARISDEDIAGYSDDIADFCAVDFYMLPNQHYQELSKTFDMENFAGTAIYGYVEYQSIGDESPTHYQLVFASNKLVSELPSLGYDFSKTRPKDYKEAYAPISLKDKYKIGKKYEISCYEGDYQYKQSIMILGYCENHYYEFGAWRRDSFYNLFWSNFLIFDDIPPLAKVESGLMMSDKTPEHYNNLGAYAKTVRQVNKESKTSEVIDIFLYWCICAMVLFIVAVTANYYFAADKMIKRSGVMYTYGGKRSDIILIEILKMLLLFLLAFAIATLTIGIVISETTYTDVYTHEIIASNLVDWKTHFTCVGITFAIYIASISLGLIKFIRFEPLKALSSSNVE